jgi:hypothetical protein
MTEQLKALAADLRSRINPAYATQLGTESYERRLCAEAIEGLIAERDALAKEAEALRQINAAYRNMETTIVISPYQQEFDKLKAKLAALESQEPVAWVWKYEYSNGGYIDYLCKSEIEAHGYTESLLMDGTVIPLFTAAGAKESK